MGESPVIHGVWVIDERSVCRREADTAGCQYPVKLADGLIWRFDVLKYLRAENHVEAARLEGQSLCRGDTVHSRRWREIDADVRVATRREPSPIGLRSAAANRGRILFVSVGI